MSGRLLSSFIALALLFGSATAPGLPTDEEVAARQVALEVAGAFQNDGFKLRDGIWSGRLEKGATKVIQVNLFAGNEYWFVLGAVAPAKKVQISVFDETGAPVEAEPYDGDASSAAGFSPGVSGPYYVKIALLEGDPAAFCMLYSYK
jgi:hypothetical protein